MDKFKRKPKPKKTFAEKAKGVFVVEGLNAVAEYIKFKPECINFVVYKQNLLNEKELFEKKYLLFKKWFWYFINSKKF